MPSRRDRQVSGLLVRIARAGRLTAWSFEKESVPGLKFMRFNIPAASERLINHSKIRPPSFTRGWFYKPT